MGNNSEDHTTNAPWSLHLELLFTSVYRQGIDRDCVTCLGLPLHPLYRLFPPPQRHRRHSGPSLCSPHPSHLQSPLPSCSMLFNQRMFVTVFTAHHGESLSVYCLTLKLDGVTCQGRSFLSAGVELPWLKEYC